MPKITKYGQNIKRAIISKHPFKLACLSKYRRLRHTAIMKINTEMMQFVNRPADGRASLGPGRGPGVTERGGFGGVSPGGRRGGAQALGVSAAGGGGATSARGEWL